MRLRKIIQICYVQGNDGYNGILYALCDDGTVWYKTDVHHSKWTQERIFDVEESPGK